MKNLLTFFLLIFLFACAPNDQFQPDNLLPCEKENWGTLNIQSTQREAFDIYINGGKQNRIEAGQKLNITKIPAGYCKFEAKEVDYILYPNVYELELTLKQCSIHPINF